MKHTKTITEVFLVLLALAIVLCVANICLAQVPDIYPNVYLPSNDEDSKINYLTRLPGGDWRLILSQVIQMILQVTGSLTLISFTVGGVMMITSQGNEEKITKGKTIMLWSVGALVIIAASYAIVLGITQLSFLG